MMACAGRYASDLLHTGHIYDCDSALLFGVTGYPQIFSVRLNGESRRLALDVYVERHFPGRGVDNGDAMRELSAQFLALAAKQSATVPLMNGHRIVGVSLVLTGVNAEWVRSLNGSHARMDSWLKPLVFKVAALPIGILVLFLIYWLLPNRRIRPGRVIPVAIITGLVLEAMKYVFLLIWPLLGVKLDHEYGVFHNSATILIWAFASAMIVLAAAQQLTAPTTFTAKARSNSAGEVSA